MRPIDADATHEKYLEEMSKLIKSTTQDNVSLEALSLLCGATVIQQMPTISLHTPRKTLSLKASICIPMASNETIEDAEDRLIEVIEDSAMYLIGWEDEEVEEE